ncbi:hypothetical protein SO694_00054053 [Aureococcus anophagefferens]|uniref:GOLD domain-containing protein n=1 Tax=Aureococcus anophagefferens TaxID=44056 RepID=A0ABR1FXM6_AURAN
MGLPRRIARLLLVALGLSVVSSRLSATRKKEAAKKLEYNDDDDDDQGFDDDDDDSREGSSEDFDDDDVDDDDDDDGESGEEEEGEDMEEDDDDDAYDDDDAGGEEEEEEQQQQATRAHDAAKRARKLAEEAEGLRLERDRKHKHKKASPPDHRPDPAFDEARAAKHKKPPPPHHRDRPDPAFDEARAAKQFDRKAEKMRKDPKQWREHNEREKNAHEARLKPPKLDGSLSFRAPFARSTVTAARRLLQSDASYELKDGRTVEYCVEYARYTTHGEAVVKKRFARLVGGAAVETVVDKVRGPRPLARVGAGAVWSPKRLEAREVAVTLNFRVAGPGAFPPKKHKNDIPKSSPDTWRTGGVAAWVASRAVYAAGPLMGSTEKFTGFGVVAGPGTIRVVVHGHIAPRTDLLEDAGIGCDAKVRLDSSRADVTVANHTKLRFLVQAIPAAAGPGRPRTPLDPTAPVDLGLSVFVDDDGGGFRPCVRSLPLPRDVFEPEWLEGAYLGVTAAASDDRPDDVVDVTKLAVVSSKEHHHRSGHSLDEALAGLAASGVDVRDVADLRRMPVAERYDRVEGILGALLASVEDLQHHMEYEILDKEAQLDEVAAKMFESTNNAQRRLKSLEDEISTAAEHSLSGRLEALEQAAALARVGDEKNGFFDRGHEKTLENTLAKTNRRVVRATVDSHRAAVSGAFAGFVVLALHGAALYFGFGVWAKLKRDKMI